mmetsp:Transcript_36196/g.32545  ORF Transcript_36196/g.32545 Transcript_36196/m.32545 type:complete len:82 (+) Transcript_36196:418-663(+)|eukprot:CAMPEP_0114599258 /NCGR_PEP_ID=MMETSP0125-20121206/21766_1 /TAXON_ID=485358 ORGANISM="Aristerostoma sp., Strain ATCC 50986" /NCGR_SAMPLE_ID=MMETSP0125 /ASSEMBLY_ACC=CAM_ASM_000245 /LENGTH=81 /DNA_ID=CAMNT_0001806085 /DNA_START=85 /DNA_END=330 /DNA_ORIENTATION=-
MNKIMKPLSKLKHFDDLEKAVKESEVVSYEDKEIPAMKVVGIFSDSDVMGDEKAIFRKLAKRFSQYLDIKFYLVTNEAVID